MSISGGKMSTSELKIPTRRRPERARPPARAARGEKNSATGNLQTGHNDIERILGMGLDKLVLQFKSTDFYAEYQLARDPIAVAKRKQEGTPAPTPSVTKPACGSLILGDSRTERTEIPAMASDARRRASLLAGDRRSPRLACQILQARGLRRIHPAVLAGDL